MRTNVRRILIVDDHALVRQTLRGFIDGVPGFHVCAEAKNPTEALAAIRGKQPDLALVDLSLGDSDGLSLTRQIRTQHPALPVVVLTMHSRETYEKSARRAGAKGYVMKSEAAERLLPAMRKVLSRCKA